jgi:general secretion pathway protein D
VPIATGLTQQPSTGTGGTTLVSTGQIQYKTVGTILNVKPRITEKGMVSMEITQEVSQIGADVLVSGQEFASFSTRKATTTASVQSGHTLIIGGMIREAKDRARAGIPFLSKIPLLGYLFSSTSNDYEKTELLVMVTPHVVSNQDEADALTERFQNRVKTIKKKIKAFADKDKENAPEEEAAGETPPVQEDESAPEEK